MLTFGLSGSSGRMGRHVESILEKTRGASVIEHFDREHARADFDRPNVWIDFSSPQGLRKLIQGLLKVRHGALPKLVVGTTGITKADRALLKRLSKRTAVFVGANFSVGVAHLRQALRLIAPSLEKLGYQVSVFEQHHRHKKDAPSGTALEIQRDLIASGVRKPQMHSVRAGELPGEHGVRFSGSHDFLEIRHFALNRGVFAQGAVDIGFWIAKRKRGYFEMGDYLKELRR